MTKMARPRKPKLDPVTGKANATPDELRIAINRLGRKIVNESNQAECDRMEGELQELETQFNSLIKPPKPIAPSKIAMTEDSWLRF